MLLPEPTAPCAICRNPAPLPPHRYFKPSYGLHPIEDLADCLRRAQQPPPSRQPSRPALTARPSGGHL